MKRVLIIIVFVLVLLLGACKVNDEPKEEENKEKIILEYKEEMYEGESFILSIKEGDDTIFSVDSDSLDLVLIEDTKIKALKPGVVKIKVIFEKADAQEIEIKIKEYIRPESVSIEMVEEGPYDLDGVYHFKTSIYPSNASEKIRLAYNSDIIEIDEDNSSIKFLKAGRMTVTAYPEGYRQIFDALDVDVLPGTEEYYSLMFIGNSFTYYKDIPSLVYNMIKADKVTVYVNSDTEGGRYLYQALPKFDTDFDGKYYTHVILQEQSGGMITNFNQFRDAILEYKEKIKTEGTQIILYQTWSDENYLLAGDESRQNQITKAYNDVASLISSKVSRVGEAFFKCHEKYSDIDLYKEDEEIGHHQNIYGAYLSACIHYHNITGRKAANNSYIPGSIDEATAKKLQEIADSMFDD